MDGEDGATSKTDRGRGTSVSHGFWLDCQKSVVSYGRSPLVETVIKLYVCYEISVMPREDKIDCLYTNSIIICANNCL